MYVYNILLCLQRLIFYPASKTDLLLIKKRNKLNTRSSLLLKKIQNKIEKVNMGARGSIRVNG